MGRKKLTGKNTSHATLVAKDLIAHKSKVKNPCNIAWFAFEECQKIMGVDFGRRAAIDYAMKKGIAYYTARTQYQHWKQAGDRDRKNAPVAVQRTQAVIAAIALRYGNKHT